MNHIGLNIQTLRKEKNINQEQLSNILGVSIAAISKWETGQSYPDITLLPAIAEYFCVSIDYLLGHRVEGGNLDKLLQKIALYMSTGDYGHALPLIEEGLKKYPNEFLLQYNMGLCLSDKATGVTIDRDIAEKSLEHFEKALVLYPKNTEFPKYAIYDVMVRLYIDMGEYDKAINIMVNTNEKGIGQSRIAECYRKKGDIKKAKLLLQRDLLSMGARLQNITDNLAECYSENGDTKKALELQKMYATFNEFFTSQTPNFYDKMCSGNYAMLARKYKQLGDIGNMWVYIEKAVYHAVRFDEKPSYNMNDINFCDGMEGMTCTSESANACDFVIKVFECEFDEFSDNAKYQGLLALLKKSETNKKSSGIWK